METAATTGLDKSITVEVLNAMKGDGNPLKLGGLTIREAPRRTQFISEGSEPGLVSLFPPRVSRFPDPDRVTLPEVCRYVKVPNSTALMTINVDTWLYPHINTDSGTGIWAEITMYKGGWGSDLIQSAFWLDADSPQHMAAVFIPPQGKVSRRFIKALSAGCESIVFREVHNSPLTDTLIRIKQMPAPVKVRALGTQPAR